MSELLFVYGTLHPERAPAEIAPIARGFRVVGPASIRGRLLDLGDYPGAILDPRSATSIPGTLFALPDPAPWSALDRYEGFLPENPSASLFLRRLIQATLPDASQALCWIYVYNMGQM
jgi:gamma-glutamylcyclotransferase (GGCT)/AIG2-like uncharacterized protein YtfP